MEEARRLYALLRQQLWELRSATLALRACLGLQRFASQLSAGADAAVPPLEVSHFLAADSADFVSAQFGTAGGARRGWRAVRRQGPAGGAWGCSALSRPDHAERMLANVSEGSLRSACLCAGRSAKLPLVFAWPHS